MDQIIATLTTAAIGYLALLIYSVNVALAFILFNLKYSDNKRETFLVDSARSFFIKYVWIFGLSALYYAHLLNSKYKSEMTDWKLIDAKQHKMGAYDTSFRMHNVTGDVFKFSNGYASKVICVTGIPNRICYSNPYLKIELIFNPYDMFSDPLEPTDEEIGMFKLEHGVNYEWIVEDVRSIIEPEIS